MAYLRAGWKLNQSTRTYVEAVHRLNSLGAVVTHAADLTSREGFEPEWRTVDIFTVDGDLINRCEIFDESDLDAALARFDQLNPPARQLENAASRGFERYLKRVVAHDWDAAAEMLADDYITDDRRHVTGGGIHGRDAEIASAQVQANLGVAEVVPAVIAVRGERLALSRVRYSGRDQELETFLAEMLIVCEINMEDEFTAAVAFDLDDIDAAIAELDARYLTGEAAAHAEAWSVIAAGFAALNRHELPGLTPDWTHIDHRPLVTIEAGDLPAYLSATWDFMPRATTYIEVVHRLSSSGAVLTHGAYGTSLAGFDAEWRMIDVLTVEGTLLKRGEIFAETDLDAALARFEELVPRTRRLENAASQVTERFFAHFAAAGWNAIAEMLADDFFSDDRRGVVGAGVQHGRDAQIVDMRAIADNGLTNLKRTVAAIRGNRLLLVRVRFTYRDQGADDFFSDLLALLEIDADKRITALLSFDPDDVDAAFLELDRRYLAGEAAPYAHVWQRAIDTLGEANRHEPGPMTTGLAYTDHRRVPFAPGDFGRAVEELWTLVPAARYRVTAVHALDAHGTVASLVIEGADKYGNELHWARTILLNADEPRMEVYEESDVDAALARFEELRPQVRRLENAASRLYERLQKYFTARDWAGMAETMAADICRDDRRRVVNAEANRGRDATIAEARAVADLGARNTALSVVAIRGERLALIRSLFSGRDPRPEAFRLESLCVVELDGDGLVAQHIMFDPDDFDAAFEELDARYLAGEAAAHSHTWSVIARSYASINRAVLPEATRDWVHIDHRLRATFEGGDLTAYLRAGWNLTPDFKTRIAAVHRLTNLGAVVTHTAHGTSQEGFDAEWRDLAIVTVDGDLVDRCEIFDETDLDTALARFEELHTQSRRLENAASRVWEHFQKCLEADDWAAMTTMTAEDGVTDDRRPVIGAGLHRGRDIIIANIRATNAIGIENVRSTVIATRGERLVLDRVVFSGHDPTPEPFHTEILRVLEIDMDQRIAAGLFFDANDIDAAIEELDARYLAGEAAAHAAMWSATARAFAALNRHETPPTASDYIIIDHQLHNEALGIADYLHATWELTPDLRMYIEAVHRLKDHAAVVTLVVRGTSPEGFDAEWRLVELLTIEGDVGKTCEVFDEADLAAAVTRFEELHPRAPTLQNAASQVYERYWAYFAAHDWDAMAAMLADDISTDDRRRVVNAGVRQGRDAELANLRFLAELRTEIDNITSTEIATRGARLALTRVRSPAYQTEVLNVVEIDADERITAIVGFDFDDIDAAFAELDARYLAGEAAAHAHTWSIVAATYASFNRHEIPATTTDFTYRDHRPIVTIDASDLPASIRAVWDLTPDIRICIEAVHRLSDLGAVVTHAARGITHEDFDAEWRMINIYTVDGDMIRRTEMFDEADIDAAIARFNELSP